MKKYFYAIFCLVFPLTLFSQSDNPPTISAVVTNIGCPGTNAGVIDITVTDGSTPYSFLWSDGSTTEDLSGILSSGNYCVTVTDVQGLTDTACWDVSSLQAEIVAITPSATTACAGDTITVTASLDFSNYIWSSGATTSEISITSTGTYSVTATNSCGIQTTINQHVHFYPSSVPTVSAVPSTIICGNTPVILEVDNPGLYSYFLWSTGATTQYISVFTPGQYTVSVTTNINCPCPPSQPVTITQGYTSISHLSSNCVNQPVQLNISCLPSTEYEIESIPFAPEPITGTDAGVTIDDEVYGPFPIGFAFNFFENIYLQFYIGSNGWVGFSGAPGIEDPEFDPWSTTSIPGTGNGTPKNCIFGPWEDWYAAAQPNPGHYIRYQVYGSEPYRRLVVTFDSIPMFDCTSSFGSFQIVLYEGTNIIDNHLTFIPSCPAWNSGHGVQGLQNEAGDLAYTVPGRNNTDWTALHESWRYNPKITSWYEGSLNTSPIGHESHITVSPDNTYYLTVSYGNDLLTVDSVTLFTALAVSVTFENVSCYGASNGSINLSVLNPADTVHYSWSNGGTTADINGLAAGNYIVTVSTDNCSDTFSINIGGPDEMHAIIHSENIGDNGYGSAYITMTGGTPPYSFHWSTGATTEDLPYLSYGIYNVTITDAHGCITTCSTFISVGIGELPDINGFFLYQNSPNPFSEKTEIQFNLPVKTLAELDINNIFGEKIAVIFRKELGPGLHSVIFDATHYPSGDYFITLLVAGNRKSIMIQKE
ncbi:MAG: SprB repeat-containing protein [Bacteroidia bacterium]|nr:SprB repeat-containing protein [Bacteroidia bacterium]